MWRAGEAELVSEALVGVEGVPLEEVGHAVPGAPAVQHLDQSRVSIEIIDQ